MIVINLCENLYAGIGALTQREKENISHIYECKSLNEQQAKLPYNKIYNGNLNNQLEIFRRLEKSLKERDKVKTNIFPCDPRDPLDCP